jgi:hypothetical protein
MKDVLRLLQHSVLLGLIMMVGVSSPAQAYLDPGTGSMIISAIVGVVATLALAIKIYWYKLRRLFRATPPSEQPPNTAPTHGAHNASSKAEQKDV